MSVAELNNLVGAIVGAGVAVVLVVIFKHQDAE